MIDKRQLIEELLECVKDSTDTETQITGLSMCAMLMNEVLDEALTIPVVVTSEITSSDLNNEFIIIRDDLVEIEKGSVVVLLTINSNGMHEFMNRSNDLCWFRADCVERKK